MKKRSSILNYVLLFIFLGVMLFAFFRDPDPIFLILGLFVFGTGLIAAQSLSEFDASIENVKKLIEKYDDPEREERMRKFEKKHGIIRQTILK